MKRLLPLIFILSVAADKTEAQVSRYGKITGRVIHAQTGNPIPGANILVINTILGAAADMQGRYIIPRVSPGRYKLEASAIGFRKQRVEVYVPSGGVVEVNFELEESVVQLSGVVITASKYLQSLKDIPVTISLLQEQDLISRNAITLDQALKYVSGVNTYMGEVNIRGSSGFSRGVGSRVLVLLDGVPFLSGDNRDVNWKAIPPSQVKQIEVMKGAGSALYGSSALGGVVNIILKEPENRSRFNIRTYSGFYCKPIYKQWQLDSKRRHFEGYSFDYTTRSGPFYLMFTSNWKYTTGFKENDDSRTFCFLGKVGYCGREDLRFHILSGYSRDKSGFYLFWRSLNQATRNGGDPEGSQTRTTYISSYIYPVITHIPSSRFFYTIRGRWLRINSEDKREWKTGRPSPADSLYRNSTAWTRGVEVQFNFQYHPQGILIFGLDAQNDRVNSTQYNNRKVLTYAFYLQNEYQFWNKFKATFGLRWDGQKVTDLGSISGEINPKLGLIYTPSGASTFRFSIGRGFRAPSVAERFISTFANMIKVSPNPGLQPERNLSAEIGMNLTLFNRANFDLALYHADYWNLIEPQLEPAKLEVKFKNIVRARIQGVETSCKVEWWKNHFTTNLSYTYIASKDLSRNPDGSPSPGYGKVLKYRPRHLFYSSADFKYKGFTAGVDFRYLSRIERVDELTPIPDLDKVVPTYVTDLRFGFTWGHLTVQFLINNLFQYYYLEAPANLGPPRSYTLQLNLSS